MLAQVPGSLGQNAKDFVHSSSEGDYLGAMGSYLSGAMDAAPLLGGPGKLARLLNYQAGNKAFDKGIDAAEPYIEKGAKAVAPTIAKGIRFIDDVLPKHKSVLAGTHLSPNLYNGQHVQIEGHAVGGKIIEAGADIAKKLFDPRFDKRVGEIPKLESLIRHVEPTHNFEAPKIYLPDYEGYPFVTSMSDRSDSNAKLLGLNNTRFNREVDLTGGQGYMFDPRNPGRVWESGKGPSSAILKAARAAKDFTGKEPVYVPWRMAPTGSDFSPMTGETMISHAQSVMGKDDKAAVDNLIKNHIPNWLGMDHPDSFTQFGNQPTATRKAVQKALDKQFRNEGGLGLGEARLAITDPNQANAPEGGLQNIGRIFTDQDLIKSGQKSRYPYGVPGEGIGTLDRDINIAQLLPNWAKERGIEDLTKPGQTDIRALQMKPYSGILTDKILQSAGYKKGGKV